MFRAIDVHGHLPASLSEVEAMLAAREAAGIELTVVHSAPGDPLHAKLFDVCARYRDQLRAYVHVNPFAAEDDLLAAADRLTGNDLCVGFTVDTSVDGVSLDDPRAEPFFALAEEIDAPVFLHPPAVATGLTHPQLTVQVGCFGDVTTALAALVLGGVLDRHPGLRVIASGGGGSIALITERLDAAAAVRRWHAPDAPSVASSTPSDALRRVWVDTATPSRLGLRANLVTFGPEQLLLGTDVPPLRTLARNAVEAVCDLPLDDTDQAAVLGGNAAALLGLAVAVG